MCLSAGSAHAQDTTAAAADSAGADSAAGLQLQEFKQAFRQLVALQDSAHADTSRVVTDPELNLEGFVLDKTRSRAGRTFYELFYRYWDPPKNANYYTIVISEKPTPWRGTQIIITMNYQQILRFPLQPRYHYIEKISQRAAAYVRRKLQQESSIEDQLLF